MNVVCPICSDLFVPSDDVYFTPCGHLFHFICLTQWLERSKTCPQCRTKVTNRSIHRIYFNLAQTDANPPNTELLQHKLDSLKFQLLLKDKEISNLSSDSGTLKFQNSGLRDEVKKLELEIDKKNSAIYALKEQMKYFRNLSSEAATAKEDLVRLRKNLTEYQGIRALLTDCCEDVENMLAETKDTKTLVTYISVMKREITNNVNRRKELRDRVTELTRKLSQITAERNALVEEQSRTLQLEEHTLRVEEENRLLKDKLHRAEDRLNSILKSRDDSSRRRLESSPHHESLSSAAGNEIENLSSASCSTPEIVNSLNDNSVQIVDEDETVKKPKIKSSTTAGSSEVNQLRRKLKPPYSDFTIFSKRKRPNIYAQLYNSNRNETEDQVKDGDNSTPVLNGYNKSTAMRNNSKVIKLKRSSTDGTKISFNDIFI